MGKAAQHPATVTRVMRASIKIGHDFLTLEESVVLPVGANDAAIAEAVATGLRIFQAQQSAIEEQISGIRANPPAPRSPKPATANQISFIERLAGNVGHSIASAVETCGFVVEGLTSDQASRVIDLLKLAEIGTDAAPAGTAVDSDEPVPASRATQPITEQQGRAITALCQVKHLTIQHAIDEHLGQNIALEHLTQQQAGSLIAALNARPPAAYNPATTRQK